MRRLYGEQEEDTSTVVDEDNEDFWEALYTPCVKRTRKSTTSNLSSITGKTKMNFVQDKSGKVNIMKRAPTKDRIEFLKVPKVLPRSWAVFVKPYVPRDHIHTHTNWLASM